MLLDSHLGGLRAVTEVEVNLIVGTSCATPPTGAISLTEERLSERLYCSPLPSPPLPFLHQVASWDCQLAERDNTNHTQWRMSEAAECKRWEDQGANVKHQRWLTSGADSRRKVGGAVAMITARPLHPSSSRCYIHSLVASALAECDV